MLCHSDFDMKEIGRQKTAVFMIVQDEKKTLHPLATIFIKQCYETLIDVAQESGGKLPYRTNFILDEFANMPPLKDVTTMVTAARSRLIRFTFIIQNYAQLTQVYGKENAETIKGNCNITYLISSELGALEELSKLCGEVKSKDKDKTASTPLVTVSDLQRLQQYETISLRLRTMPFKTKLIPNWKMNWGKTYEKATYPERPRQNIELFDIREFVKEQKKKKMAEMMNSQDGDSMPGGMMNMPGQMSNPMFGGSPFAMNNPFSGRGESSPMSGGLNVDDLVKRIDAKIAELEEEERLEKEKEAQNNHSITSSENIIPKEAEFVEKPSAPLPPIENTAPTNVVPNTVAPIIEEPQEKIKEEPKQTDTVNIADLSNQSSSITPNDNDDDNFFDDFFSDE